MLLLLLFLCGLHGFHRLRYRNLFGIIIIIITLYLQDLRRKISNLFSRIKKGVYFRKYEYAEAVVWRFVEKLEKKKKRSTYTRCNAYTSVRSVHVRVAREFGLSRCMIYERRSINL